MCEFETKPIVLNAKSEMETMSGISYERMTEIATRVIDALFDDDKETAIEFLKGELDMQEHEAEYFGRKEELFPKTYKIVEVTFERKQKATIKVVMPENVDSWHCEDYIESQWNLEPDDDYDAEWELHDYDDVDYECTSEEIRRRYDDGEIWNYDDFDRED